MFSPVSRLSSLRDGVPFAEGFLGSKSSKGDHEQSPCAKVSGDWDQP